MASPAQITANRANAQRSTGPRSAEGKSVSRFNALQHGVDASSPIIPGEDRAEYQALADSYAADLAPDSVTSHFHIDTMLHAEWQKRRLQLVEADLTRILLNETPGQSLADALLTDTPAARLLVRTQRQIAAHQRTWYRAYHQLLRECREAAVDTQQRALDAYMKALTGQTRSTQSRHAELAPRNEPNSRPPAPRPTAEIWPPTDPNTGKPLYFVG